MLNFESDYVSGCHESLLKALMNTNDEIVSGYGKDYLTDDCTAVIKNLCKDEKADVEFVSGGTQANQLVIASLLQKHQGVVCAQTAHINHHEGGSIELTSHKVIEIAGKDGKIDIDAFEDYVSDHYDNNREQRVSPGVLCIAFPTELGTLYSKAELERLSSFCHRYDMTLYIDGARLGYGLMSSHCDVTIEDIAKLSDAFYIGGTKCGALCGEAIVFPHGTRPRYFTTYKKQHGALLAKNRILAVQFMALLKDNLYFDLAKHADRMATLMKDSFAKHGMKLLVETSTNQLFVVLTKNQAAHISESVKFKKWSEIDENHISARFVTCWSTTEAQVNELNAILDECICTLSKVELN